MRPQVVFGPQRGDAHQDHRLLAELLPTEFRDHLVLGYEILKWEADTPQPDVFHPLEVDVAEEKARLLHKHYPSQAGHDWFDEQAFLGLSRLRGVQCHAPHAEAFIVEKATSRSAGCDRAARHEIRGVARCEYWSPDTRDIWERSWCRFCEAAGHEVTGLDSGFFADCVLGPAPADPPGIGWTCGM